MPDSAPSQETRPRRRRAPPRKVTVEAVERVTPRLTRVTFGGETLEGFGPPRPCSHVKLLIVPEGSDWTPADEEAPRPPSRTYTPRHFDPGQKRLVLEFVHHGDGLAALWAQRAKAGDEAYIGGPGGGYEVPEDATDIVLVADDTAMPAAGTILETLPKGCKPTVFCEVPDAAEERPLSPRVAVEPVWLHRETAGKIAGTLLEEAVRGLDAPADAYWWIACEAAAMRRIRHYLLTERHVDPKRIHTRGYWKLGETNYPDHDYGDD